MKRFDPVLINHLKQRLEKFDQEFYPLPGIADVENKESFIKQIIDSIRRIKYVKIISDKNLSGDCIDATSSGFNPIMAASWHNRNNNFDESVWLVFLLTYFGKSRTGWSLIRAFYSGLNTAPSYWTWSRINNNFSELEDWLILNARKVKSFGVFSNHRKYTSFRVNANNGPIQVFSNYRQWIGDSRSHNSKIQSIINEAKDNNYPVFRSFYKNLPQGLGFARLGKFDFLTMLSKLKIVDMVADSTYISESSGPKRGAKLLLFGNPNITVRPKVVEEIMDELANYLQPILGIEDSMQVIEDSVCNWQKSPDNYERYTG